MMGGGQSREVGSIHYTLGLDKSHFDKGHSDIANKLGGLTKKFAMLAAASSAAFVGFGLKVAGDLESARMGFVTLLGSAEEADKVLAMIKKDAAQTPFELPGLIKANQNLTAVTKNGERSEKILLNVGKALAASGKGQPELDRMIANLQQIGLTGKITAMDIKQFGTSGINILELLADYYGTTTDKVTDMVQNSKDGFADIEAAFEKAGGAGGKFEKAFTNQAGTFNQSLSNMKDAVAIFASDFVKETGIFDFAKNAMQGFTQAIVDNQEKIYAFVDRLKEFGKRVFEVAMQVADYLRPHLEQLWDTISEKLLPALGRFWHEYLEPLLPILGIALVAAIVAVIDIANGLITIISSLMDWMSQNREIVLLLAAAFGILALKMKFGAIVAAFNTSMAAARGAMAATQGSLGALGGALTGFTGFAVLGLAAAAATVQVVKLINAVRDLNRLAGEASAGQTAQGQGDTAFYTSLKRALDEGRIDKAEYDRRFKAYNVSRQSDWQAANRAIGGPVAGNRPYIVGENGPEMFIPRRSGKIMTAGETAGMNGTTNIYGNISLGNDVDVDNFFRKLTRNQELSMKGLSTQAGSLG